MNNKAPVKKQRGEKEGYILMEKQLILSTLAGVAGGALSKSFEGPLKSVNDLWYSAFGYKTEMARIKKEAEVKAYAEKIIQELHNVKPENIQQPKLNIVGPAIEASKYYIEEPPLRDMFAKLIASACDSTKSEVTHPAFVECIKQMNSNDAILLTKLKSFGPLADYSFHCIKKPGQVWNLARCVCLSDSIPDYSEKNTLSISNLHRLNIITINTMDTIKDESFYKQYTEIALYQQALQLFDLNKHLYSRFELAKYYYQITPFGRSFVAICL